MYYASANNGEKRCNLAFKPTFQDYVGIGLFESVFSLFATFTESCEGHAEEQTWFSHSTKHLFDRKRQCLLSDRLQQRDLKMVYTMYHTLIIMDRMIG